MPDHAGWLRRAGAQCIEVLGNSRKPHQRPSIGALGHSGGLAPSAPAI